MGHEAFVVGSMFKAQVQMGSTETTQNILRRNFKRMLLPYSEMKNMQHSETKLSIVWHSVSEMIKNLIYPYTLACVHHRRCSSTIEKSKGNMEALVLSLEILE